MSSRTSWWSSLASRVAGKVGRAIHVKPTAGGSGPTGTGAQPRPEARTRPLPRSLGARRDDEEESPGRFGPDATTEVAPDSVGAVRMEYHPNRDGDPDPGEIVWTWVPFEENDGRGKDRPVLVVAVDVASRRRSRTVLAVQLTSKNHAGETDFVSIGSGSWDGEHRPSWVNIDRVLRVHPTGMRREAAALDATNYSRVEAALRHRYGWQ